MLFQNHFYYFFESVHSYSNVIIVKVSNKLKGRTAMHEASFQNKTAWEYKAYDAWVKRDGPPAEKARKITENPLGCLKRHQKYFRDIAGLKIANLCGSNGRKAVPLALLGADVTVFDISEGNKKYALELSAAAKVSLNYVVCDLYELDLNAYEKAFDMLYLEGGILHYFHDIDKLMAILYTLLKPGGQMVLSDFHPYRKLLPVLPDGMPIGNYFDISIHEKPVAYANFLDEAENGAAPTCSLRFYNLSEILNAVARCGFVLNEFLEHPSWENEKLPGEFTVLAKKQ